jgi:hypothetical protein
VRNFLQPSGGPGNGQRRVDDRTEEHETIVLRIGDRGLGIRDQGLGL